MRPVVRYAESLVPTEYGPVRLLVYRAGEAGAEEHVAVVAGELAALAGGAPILARVHSECWTGEVLHSRKCDCREQLDVALRAVTQAGRGVVVYLRQEGRGIGLGNKIRAYALQEAGADTVEANERLGFEDDARSYEVAGAILADLGVVRVELMTNNPRKIAGLRACGVDVTARRPLVVDTNEHSADYLAVKAKKLGHEL